MLDPNDQWIDTLSDADAARADATVSMIRGETYVTSNGARLTFDKR